MKMKKASMVQPLLVVTVTALVLWGAGCQQPVVKHEETGPVFFPPPPNTPRLQFLTSFSGREISSDTKRSFLETYIIGDTEPAANGGRILQPYGIAVHKGKIYICDVGDNKIKVIDVAAHAVSVFPGGRSLHSPVNIFIEPDGTKYIADSQGGAVVVYDDRDKLIGFLGNQLEIKPTDVVVDGKEVYITDGNKNQVMVLDKYSGQLLRTLGKNMADPENQQADEFALIAGLALDGDKNVYVTDKIKGVVTKFAPDESVVRTYSRPGSLPDCLVRGKGIELDDRNRLWVVDAGPAMAVKVYRNEDGRFLMIFGLPGTEPGQMYMPASIVLDDDPADIELFKSYAVDGAELKHLVFVTNQYGPHKVSVYGFGTFPEKYRLQGVSREAAAVPAGEPTTSETAEGR